MAKNNKPADEAVEAAEKAVEKSGFEGKVIRKFTVGSKKDKKKVYNIGDTFKTENEDVFNALKAKRRIK